MCVSLFVVIIVVLCAFVCCLCLCYVLCSLGRGHGHLESVPQPQGKLVVDTRCVDIDREDQEKPMCRIHVAAQEFSVHSGHPVFTVPPKGDPGRGIRPTLINNDVEFT